MNCLAGVLLLASGQVCVIILQFQENSCIFAKIPDAKTMLRIKF